MSAPPSWGAPGDTGVVVDSPTLTLSELGVYSDLTFYGLAGANQLTVPIVHGLSPTALNANVELPINFRSGIITVTQDERTIARVDLPGSDQASIVIPLAGAEVVNNSVSVLVHAYLSSPDRDCFDPGSPLRLANATISYTGVEHPPTTVAHFLPPVLRKLTISLPQSPSAAESDAAVRLAAATAAHYGRQAPEIAVTPLNKGQTAPPTPSGPLERQIVIKEGPEKGFSVQGAGGVPWLLISGSLRRTEESDPAVLFSDLSRLALAPKAVVGSADSKHQFPGNTATLRELGQPSLESTALRPRVGIALDQTRFGRSIHAVRVHLQGSYSPTPANIGGQLVAKVGPDNIDAWPTDGHGIIDRWVDVPDRVLQRYSSIELTLNIAGNAGHCGDFYTAGAGDQLLTLTINGDSTVQSSPASPPVPDGLRAMPQALMPWVQVGIEPSSFSDTVRAVQVLAGLQRLSSVPIDTAVTSVQEAINSSNPAILIAANGWNHPDIALPVSAEPTGPITVNAIESNGKPASLTLDPALQFASLQAVFHRGRSLLVATSNGAPAQLDALLGSLNSDTAGWPRINGVALVSVPGQDPVTVDNLTTAGPVLAAPESHSGSTWLWWLGGVWLAVLAVGAGAIVIRLRRRSART